MVKTRLLEYETIIQILSQTHIRKPFRNSIRSQEKKENKGKEKGKGDQQRKNPADMATQNVEGSLRESDLNVTLPRITTLTTSERSGAVAGNSSSDSLNFDTKERLSRHPFGVQNLDAKIQKIPKKLKE